MGVDGAIKDPLQFGLVVVELNNSALSRDLAEHVRQGYQAPPPLNRDCYGPQRCITDLLLRASHSNTIIQFTGTLFFLFFIFF